MTKRTIRHSLRYFKVIPFFLAVAALSAATGSLVRGAWRWAVLDQNVIGGIVTAYSAIALLVLVLLLIKEAGLCWLRWAQEQEAEDACRCSLPDCDRVLQKPYIHDNEIGDVCMSCFRRIMRAESAANDLPALARKAGA